MRDSLRLAEEAQEGKNAAIRACNLSETELLVGEIAATATAEKSVTLADRTGDPSLMMLFRVTRADALHAAGEWEKAAALFADAERRQQESQPQFPFLCSVRGYQYCDLLLSRGQAAEARDRAARTLEIARSENWVLDIALDNVTLGRAHLDLAMQTAGGGPSAVPASTDARTAPKGSMKPSKACALPSEATISLAAFSPAPHSAAPLAIGMARRATGTKQKRSLSGD
jgi:hypothetical protein